MAKDWDKMRTKYNIKPDTNILTSYYSMPRRFIRNIAKNIFPNFYNKRIQKENTFNKNSLSPDSEIWDSKFS